MLDKPPPIRDLHECEKSEGKIIAIMADKMGRTFCSYCNKQVDYSPLHNNKQFQARLKEIIEGK